MKGKTLNQITNTPKAGLKELPSLPDNEEFNVEIISKDSGKVYTVSTDAFNSNISGSSSSLFPNGIKIVTEDYAFQASDAGKIIYISGNEITVGFDYEAPNPFKQGDYVGVIDAGSIVDGSTGNAVIYSLNNEPIQILPAVFSESEASEGEILTIINQDSPTNDGSVASSVLGGVIDGKSSAKYLYDKSQNAIPLSGTVDGSPVTGDIEVESINIKKLNEEEDGYNYINFGKNEVNIVVEKDGFQRVFEINGGNGFTIKDINPDSRGLSADHDFTPNITDLDYTQKKYVDKYVDTHIAFTTVPTSSTDTGTKGQMAVDSSYLYVCVATDTWTRIALTW